MNNYYKFIKPRKLEPRKPKIAIGSEATKAIQWLITQTPEVVHYDLETTGLNFADIKQVVTTIGLATPDWVVGLDLLDVDSKELASLWAWLGKQNLGGFNLSFDLAWPWRTPLEDGRVLQNIDNINVVSDTLLWYRLLATESHPHQSHSLENMIETVLGWPRKFLQKAWLKEALERHSIKKCDMWVLALKEPQEYTMYCAMDAEASFQADGVFQDTLEEHGFAGLRQYHDSILVPKIKRTIEAGSFGIPVDREKLAENIELVQGRLLSLEAKAIKHEKMQPFIVEYETAKLDKNHSLRCELKKHWAKKADEPWKHPKVYRLEYITSENKRAKLPAWCRKYGGKFYKPETKFVVSGKGDEWPRFNVNSIKDMKWLIYDKWLEGNYDVWYRNPDKPEWGGLVTVYIDGKDYQLKLTEAGGLPTGGDILTLFGEIGLMLNEYKTLKKLLGDFLLKFYNASERTGYVHSQTKILGAATGRAAGGSQ